jgi:hypothetical protein
MADYSSSDLPKPKMGPPKRSPFQQAFREARAAGKKDFTFNGKKYSTEMAKPKAEAKAPAGPRRDMAAEAKGAETLERMKSRAERGMAVRSNEEMRDEAKGRTLAALGAAATLAGGPLARMAMGRAAPAPAAKRIEPMLSTSRASDSGKFRKSDVSLKEATEAAKKGRTEPTFKKGGSVKGGGCETRSKKTRFI